MSVRKLCSYFVCSLMVGLLFTQGVFAEELKRIAEPKAAREVCAFEFPEQTIYDAEVVTIRKKLKVEIGEEFRVKVFLKNKGNMPWFAKRSVCSGPKLSLGTDKERDRDSEFFYEGAQGWESANRVAMDQMRVNPGEIASFTFYAKAGEKSAVYKEYFTPMVDGITWMDNAQFGFDVIVGNPTDSAVNSRKKMQYASRTGNVSSMIDLNGKKKVVVDLSDQTMSVQLGEEEILATRVSTGGPGHRTPTGTHKIWGKNDVRIGGKAPHYIMPKFQMLGINGRGFTGYGIHALPSLGSAQLRARIKGLQRQGLPIPTSLYTDDTLWNEAVSHLGNPVSHGCIRVAPQEASFLFGFTDIGETQVVVQS